MREHDCMVCSLSLLGFAIRLYSGLHKWADSNTVVFLWVWFFLNKPWSSRCATCYQLLLCLHSSPLLKLLSLQLTAQLSDTLQPLLESPGVKFSFGLALILSKSANQAIQKPNSRRCLPHCPEFKAVFTLGLQEWQHCTLKTLYFKVYFTLGRVIELPLGFICSII